MINIGVSTSRVDAASAVADGIDQRLRDASAKGFEVSQQRVPVDRGELLRSGVPPQREADGSYVWGYTADHARPMEFGTAAFTPPIEPLLRWGRRVLGSRGAGAAVWHKIRREGIDAQPYVRPGADAMKAWIRSHGLKSAVEGNL